MLLTGLNESNDDDDIEYHDAVVPNTHKAAMANTIANLQNALAGQRPAKVD